MNDKGNIEKIISEIKSFPEEVRRKLTPMINSNIAYISRTMQKDVTERYYIDPSLLRKKFSVIEAKGSNPFAVIRTQSKTLGLENFRVSKNGKYLSTGVRRDLGVKQQRNFFIFQNGTIFSRFDKHKTAIRRMYGPSVVGMVDNNNLPQKAASIFYNLLQKDIEKVLKEELYDK